MIFIITADRYLYTYIIPWVYCLAGNFICIYINYLYIYIKQQYFLNYFQESQEDGKCHATTMQYICHMCHIVFLSQTSCIDYVLYCKINLSIYLAQRHVCWELTIKTARPFEEEVHR